MVLVETEQKNFYLGLAASCLGHLVLFYFILFRIGANFRFAETQIYSVTLEGGKTLGGISQAPKDPKAVIAPPKKVSGSEAKPDAKTPDAEKIVPDENAEVSLAEKKKEDEKKAKEKKLADEKAKKEKEKKAADEKKKKEEEAKKKAKAKTSPAADPNKEYQKVMQRYLGESTDAGGKKEFGAGLVTGGKGKGGGLQRPPEFFAYVDLIKSRIKGAWNWYDPNTSLKAHLQFNIGPDGRISNVSVLSGSGNSEFDNSVVRAINKVEKLPPPEASIRQYFSTVRIVFDPRE